MPPWHPDRLLKTLLRWSAVTFVIFWLPAVRGLMDGAPYEWGLLGFGGTGMGGDYWLPLLGAASAVAFLTLGWRGARPPFHALLVAWHACLTAGVVWAAAAAPDDFRFRGDTLGVDVSLAWVGPALFGGFLLLAVLWVARDLRAGRDRRPPPWTPRNRRFALLAAALLPLQLALLRFGGPQHGTGDQLGVLLTLAQWAIVNAALYPWPASADQGHAGHATASVVG